MWNELANRSGRLFWRGLEGETLRRCVVSVRFLRLPTIAGRVRPDREQLLHPMPLKNRRIRQMERALERKAVEAEILRKVAGRSCGELHSQARKLVEQSYEPNVVASAPSISRSSLYYCCSRYSK